MSTTEIERLVRDYDADPALRGRIDAARDFDQAAQIAHAAGYGVTADEIQARLDIATELTGRQLDAVAAGYKAH
jgi:predicted ribosomally synthesized peptide with nif11-like leader